MYGLKQIAAILAGLSSSSHAHHSDDETLTTVRSLVFGAEESSTPCADNQEYSASTGTKWFDLITLPTTYSYYVITGIEWKNGSAVAGNIISGVVLVDDIPIVLNGGGNPTICPGFIVAQAGTNAVQRTNAFISQIIPGGTKIGVYVQNSSTSATLRYQDNQANTYRKKGVAYGTTVYYVDAAGWALSTNRIYLKLYYKGIL